jgi:hypothetical protein
MSQLERDLVFHTKRGFKMHGNVEVHARERKQANEAQMPRLFDHWSNPGPKKGT